MVLVYRFGNFEERVPHWRQKPRSVRSWPQNCIRQRFHGLSAAISPFPNAEFAKDLPNPNEYSKALDPGLEQSPLPEAIAPNLEWLSSAGQSVSLEKRAASYP